MFKNSKKTEEKITSFIPWEAAEKIARVSMAISPKFKPYEDYFIKTIKPYIKITPVADSDTELWQSKFGGFPYLPKEFEYPKNIKGDNLYLAAQINFAEMPQLENFPDEGILEFFLSPNSIAGGIDGNYGARGTTQDDFRIIYFPKINKNNLREDFSFLKPLTRGNFPDYGSVFPVIKPYSLSFEKDYAPISVSDYQFANKNFFEEELGDENYELLKSYIDKFNFKSSKIGGYPIFEQYDPREASEYIKGNYILLFMMGNTSDIMQGDGILNFFIRERDLLKKDFSKILAHFDCG